MHQKIKHLQYGLEICLETQSIFEYSIGNFKDSSQPISEDFCKHTLLFERQLQFVLKTLIKLHLNTKDPTRMAQRYKEMYMETLKAQKTGDMDTESLSKHFMNILQNLRRAESTGKV